MPRLNAHFAVNRAVGSMIIDRTSVRFGSQAQGSVLVVHKQLGLKNRKRPEFWKRKPVRCITHEPVHGFISLRI